MLSIPIVVLASLIGVVVVVGLSMYDKHLNMGIVAIVFAIFIGAIWTDLGAMKILQSLPLALCLFLILGDGLTKNGK
jgi:uncharacterized membrane protein